MKKKNVLYILLTLCLPIIYISLGSNSGGVTGNSTSGCSCHGPANTGTTSLVTGVTGGFVAGQTYTMTLVVQNSAYMNAPNRAGFNLTVNQGTLAAGAGMLLVGTQELAHSTPVTMSSLGAATWTFDWTAPTSTAVTSVTFSIAGNATNGNFGTGGDAYNLSTTVINAAASSSSPTVTGVTATAITESGATINAMVNPNGSSAGAAVEYGLTTAYGNNAAMTPTTITGTTAQAMTATLTGLTSNTIYHYRVRAATPTAVTNSPDATFTTNFASQVIDFKESDYQVFPNPTSNQLTIEFTERIKTMDVKMYNATGQKVMMKQVWQENKLVRFDVSNLAKGNYILNATVNGKHLAKKINIQ